MHATRGVLIKVPVSDTQANWMVVSGLAFRHDDGSLTLSAAGVAWTSDWLRGQMDAESRNEAAG